MKTTRSLRLFSRAQHLLPGGVDSPVRAFKSVGGSPLFIRRALGSTLVDIDGNKFIDYVMSWGPLIHGHAAKGLVQAIARAAKAGTSFGAPSPLEVTLAERVTALMPSLERVRFVNSGTEAAMSALRVARAATRRDRIIKFQGCYHGHADAFLVQAGSGALTFGTPDSPGVTAGASSDTLVASYNDLDSVHQVFDANRDRIAAVIVEPIAGNMGVVPPAEGFLAGLRDACTANGALLIFDEVISGFRASAGGAQKTFGVRPDLTCLGKALASGMPLAALLGPAALLRDFYPRTHFGPTFREEAYSMHAACATLDVCDREPVPEHIWQHGERLRAGIEAELTAAGLRAWFKGPPFRMSLFFDEPDRARWLAIRTLFHQEMLRKGVSMFANGVMIPCLAHDDSALALTIGAARHAAGIVQRALGAGDLHGRLEMPLLPEM